MTRKRKKTAVAATGVLISALMTGILVGCFLIWEFGMPQDHFENQGDQAFERGDYADALQYWLRAKELVGQSGRVYAKMGAVYLKLSNLDQAEICFKKVLEKNPEDVDTQQQIIRIALVRGDTAAAGNLLSKRLKNHDSDPVLFMLSGDLAMLQTEFKTAEAAYEKAAALLPGQIRPRLKLAICFHQQKKAFEAEKMVTLCRTQGIKTPMDLMLAADYYALAGDDTRAERYLLMAVDSDPGDLEFKTRLCLFYRVAGKLEKAAAYLKKLIAEYPENTGFKMMLADFYLAIEDMAGAEKLLDQLAQASRDTPGYHLLMGKFWLFKGLYSHAVSYLKTALDTDYGLLSAHYLLGVAYFAGGQSKLAEKAFLQALMLDPDHEESIFAMAALNYKREDYGLADQYADQFLGQEPSSARVWKLKGLCALGRRDPSCAIGPLSKSWHLGDASAHFFLGQAFEAQGMVQEALTAYSQVFEDAPLIYPALYAYARLASDQGLGERVFEKIDALAGHDANPAVYYTGAKICLGLKDYDRCQAYIDKAMAKKEVSGPFFLLQAALFEATGKDDGVEKTLTECITKLPQYVGGWLKLSAYYVKKQRISDAAQVMEQALNSFPDHPEIKGNLAWLLLEEETDFDRALDLAREAYDTLPGQAWLMDTLGWAYYHKKIYSQAQWMLEQAEELTPGNGMIQYHLGMVLYRRGKLFQAKTKLESALRYISIDTPQRDEAESLLAGLNGKEGLKDEGGNMIFNPEATPSLDLESQIPLETDESEDILKPDWSNMDSIGY
ncbi:MAG: tetratricopeptide repeat protein [Desulfobacter postgatei]|uniref:tetratricopeptide repeat protein n=1 Tax=Desulfobacter postgatei TaxID=2293 RepID=UPI0023F49B54|nr:tetratricopeptide repeat protein [Desulfobacter postgatei]MDD4272843.1 tetratricopeptide repeat protein [Desulfobacter postgatei]